MAINLLASRFYIVPPTEILDCPVKPGNDPGKVDLKEKCSGRILSIEFPENRENSREFVIFLTCLTIFDVE